MANQLRVYDQVNLKWSWLVGALGPKTWCLDFFLNEKLNFKNDRIPGNKRLLFNVSVLRLLTWWWGFRLARNVHIFICIWWRFTSFLKSSLALVSTCVMSTLIATVRSTMFSKSKLSITDGSTPAFLPTACSKSRTLSLKSLCKVSNFVWISQFFNGTSPRFFNFSFVHFFPSNLFVIQKIQLKVNRTTLGQLNGNKLFLRLKMGV